MRDPADLLAELIQKLLVLLVHSDWSGYAVLTLGIFFTGYFFIQAYELREEAEHLRDEPFTPIGQLDRPGFFKLHGRVACETALFVPYLPGVPLVYYELTRQKEEFRETDGETQFTERVWKTIGSDVGETPFCLVDESGNIPVRPKGSKMDQEVLVSQTSSLAESAGLPPGDLVGLIVRSDLQGLPSPLEQRLEITGLRSGAEVTILGLVRHASGGTGPLFIGADPDENYPFLITPKSLRELYREKMALVPLKALLAAGVLVLTLALYFLALPALRATWTP